MTEKEKIPKPKFFTTNKILAILAALFTSLGIYFYAKNIAPLPAGGLLLIGLIFTIILFSAHRSH